MARYRVVEPCAYVVDGAAVHHTRAGAVVELGDDTAKGLGGKVEFVSFSERIEPEAFVKAVKRPRSRRKPVEGAEAEGGGE